MKNAEVEKMERILSKLFDYQKFQKNPRISAMIQDTERRLGKELEDSELFSVAAAGETELSADKHKPGKEDKDESDN